MQRYGDWRNPPNFLRNSENIPNFAAQEENLPKTTSLKPFNQNIILITYDRKTRRD